MTVPPSGPTPVPPPGPPYVPQPGPPPFASAEPPRRPSCWERFTDALSRIPLRTRIGILVMAAVGMSVAIACFANFEISRNEVRGQFDNDLTNAATASALTTARAMQTGNIIVIPGYSSFAVIDSAGNAVVDGTREGVPTPPFGAPEIAVAAGDSAISVRNLSQNGTPVRMVAVSLADFGLPGHALVVTRSLSEVNHTLHRLALSSLLVALSGIAVAGVAGFSIGRGGLRPVDQLTEAAEHVATTGDLQPIDVHGHDELARMATAFNSMLAALSRSREHQKRLVADAGHELRTPLTSMRTNIDLLAQSFAHGANGLPEQDRNELIADVRAQMEELSLLVGDLVELSRDDPHEANPEVLDLADVVRNATERVRRRAAGVHFDLRLAPWYCYGQQAQLERAVTNLLDNAAKFSPQDGTVTIDLHDGLLQVADEGPGIPDQDLAHVFERFFRSAEARTMPGSGLGLAIVRQVVENHGGRVAAARAPSGGALLGVWLPGSTQPPPTPLGVEPTRSLPRATADDPGNEPRFT